MEATYCVGSDVDVCRMFDQYLYKRSENVDLSLSIPQSNFQSNAYDMGDQTFHTPSFGDEDFDIPAINQQQQQQQQQQQPPPNQQQQSHNEQQQHYQQAPMQQMQQMGQQMAQQQDGGMGMHDPTGGYQQPLYLSGPDHGMVNPSYHSPQPNYAMSPSQQQQQHNQLLMIQQQQQHQQMMMGHGQPQPPPPPMSQYGTSPQHPQGRGNSPPAPGQEPTTSEDSDDSTPHAAMMTGLKRPSPEPADQTLTKQQKKPKVQKKKKKRDPNEPQKPVSAYALFFRDTQAAIKGQNPNASFGEVSKIVASMWDALDSDHKNVYKKKTEAAKKEYLKALAAYRASLVSKGAGEGEGMYGNYANYNTGAPQYGGYTPQGAIPSPPMSSAATPPTQASAMNKKSSPPMIPPNMNQNQAQQGQQQHPNMMQSPMGPVSNHMNMQHMQAQPQHNSYMQQVPQQQHMPVSPQQQHAVSPHMQQHVSPPPSMVSSSPPISAQQPPSSGPNSVAQQVGQGQMRPPNSCIRHGCPNPAITNSEWEDEYCSNECVVSHCRGVCCRDVFTTWVTGNKNQSQNFSTVK